MDGVQHIARSILNARRKATLLQPFTSQLAGLTVSEGYAAAAELRRLREAAGENAVGRKIGFTNRNIWPEYGVYGPIWGEMYDTTVFDVVPGAVVNIGLLSQPRLEPEIVLGIETDLEAGASLSQAESAIGWIAHGFEIVQTVFPDWKFAAADCIAEGALHGLLLVGPRVRVDRDNRAGLASLLSSVRLDLSQDGRQIESGIGANALDGPIQALITLVDGLADEPSSLPVRAGECVTTGTLTRAFPIAAGQTWSTEIVGCDLAGLNITFR